MLEACWAVAEEQFASNIFQEGILFTISLVAQVVGKVLSSEPRTADDDTAYARICLVALICCWKVLV